MKLEMYMPIKRLFSAQRDIPQYSGLGNKALTVEDRDVAAIGRLGLTEYEARIYLVLVKMGPIKASELSFFAQVPRTKTYGAIKQLEQKGLVRIIPGKPEFYAAHSPNEALMPLVTKLDHDVRDSESVVQQLAVAYESSRFVKREVPKESTQFWEIDGRQNLINKLNQMFLDVEKNISYCTTAAGLIRAYKAHSEALERARRKGVVVRILSTISADNSGVANELSQVLELKNLQKPIGAVIVSVDGRELVAVESRPDDLRTDRGSDLAIWTTNKLLVEVYEKLFEWLWNASPQIEVTRHRSS
jgi:sugar-specific transcriptional regulator TrmB